MKIVILDGHCANPGDCSWKALEEIAELTIYPRSSKEEVVERAKDAEIILTNKVSFNDDLLSKFPKLKYIGILATGFNIVDINAAKQRGIVVTNVPAYSTDSVAQLTFAHILNITNRIEHYANMNRTGAWSKSQDFCFWDTPLIELAGKTLGIVGLGNIGYKVANIALTFGMDVFAFTSKDPSQLPNGIKKATLDGLFSVSDIITLHCPLNNQTREMINKNSIKKIKKGAILINTGRGPLVNEEHVAKALNEGWLAAYASDVMCQEPPQEDNPLFKQKNAYITPHIAWATREARARMIKIAIDNVKKYIEREPQNVVNK